MNKKTHPAPFRVDAGFTLVEVMVVIVILGLLATLVVQSVGDSSDKAREQTARSNCVSIAAAVRLFRAEKGKLPENLEELVTKDEKGRSYLEELPADPWNHPYELRLGDNPNEWEVISVGMDGSPGTEDDLSSKVKKDQ
ncbi:MAG: type II secretion system major pseudopilin GspG [Planctomycetota bacterium]